MFLNVTEGEHCPYCGDDAQVLVGTESRQVFDYRDGKGRRVAAHNQAKVAKQTGTAEFEQFGPCPFCEKGKLLEFPQERVGPWGKDGYWRGRSTDHIQVPKAAAPPSPLEVRKLLTNVGWVKEIE